MICRLLSSYGIAVPISAPGDRRQIPLRLSPEGEALVGEMRGPAVALLDEILRGLGGELEAVTLTLERLTLATATARDRLVPTGAELNYEPSQREPQLRPAIATR